MTGNLHFKITSLLFLSAHTIIVSAFLASPAKLLLSKNWCRSGYVNPTTNAFWRINRNYGHIKMNLNNGGRKPPRLGPGLFDPMIQLGPEDKWPEESAESDRGGELLVSQSALAALFTQLDTDANGRIDAPELLALALALGHRWNDSQATIV